MIKSIKVIPHNKVKYIRVGDSFYKRLIIGSIRIEIKLINSQISLFFRFTLCVFFLNIKSIIENKENTTIINILSFVY